MSKMIKTIQQKLSTHYGVKTVQGELSVKDVNEEGRTVQFVGNTFFYIDSDQDMLISGCCNKSIADRGVNSKAAAKIKHQSDHVLMTSHSVGRFTTLEERELNGKSVLYCESFIPNTTKGNDDLENYKAGIYDNHSIGFIYKDIILASKNSTNEMERKAWDEYYPKALNPEKADELGYFYVVKEIELYEVSVVSFGANSLTETIGVKSDTPTKKVKSLVNDRLDALCGNIKSGTIDKKTIDLQTRQLKQLITDLELAEPLKQGIDNSQPPRIDTHEVKNQNIITNLSKFYK